MALKGRVFAQLVLHASFCTIFAVAYHQRPFIPGSSDTYAGRYKYLTMLNVLMSILYYGACTLIDVKLLLNFYHVGSVKTRDYFFTSVLFPISASVSLLFWGLFLADPNLIAPAFVRAIIPPQGFYNHATHTAPIVSTLLESLITPHRVKQRFVEGAMGGMVFSAAYLLWVFWIAFYADIWVYPVLRVLSPLGRAAFLSFAVLLGAALYQVGVSIKRLCWSEEVLYSSHNIKKE